jgi:hypothetical protein
MALKLTPGKKLGLGFGCILGLMVLSAAIVRMKANAIKEAQEHEVTVRVPTIASLRDLQRDLNQTLSKGREAILAGAAPDKREAAKKTFDEAWGEADKDVAALDALAPHWMLQSNHETRGGQRTRRNR